MPHKAEIFTWTGLIKPLRLDPIDERLKKGEIVQKKKTHTHENYELNHVVPPDHSELTAFWELCKHYWLGITHWSE